MLGEIAWAQGAGFSGGVTPSRFELDANTGELLRRSIKIYNLGNRPQQFTVKTVEWDYSEAGRISFSEPLADDSCREWVRLERHRINVLPDPQRPRNYRFELQVPDGAEARECRFAIMIESLAEGFDPGFADGAVSVPITGRIAVIVYVNVGGVEADIEIGDIAMQELDGKTAPALRVTNSGAAHGRLDSDLVAETQSGDSVRVSVATSPVLPGQTRYLAVTPEAGRVLTYPIRVRGKVYSDGEAHDVDQRISDSRSLIAQD